MRIKLGKISLVMRRGLVLIRRISVKGKHNDMDWIERELSQSWMIAEIKDLGRIGISSVV